MPTISIIALTSGFVLRVNGTLVETIYATREEAKARASLILERARAWANR